MFDTLLLPGEVIYHTGISKEFPRCTLRTIHGVEYNEFLNCIGSAFYEELNSHKNDYSMAEIYDNTKDYIIDDVVKYEGVYYKVIQPTTGNNPLNYEYWELAPKFNKECLEVMWCSFLAEYLSWQVIYDRLPFIATQIKGTGIVKIFGNTFQAGSSKDFENLSKAVLRSAERSFNNFDNYVINNNESGCFDSYKGIAVSCCSDCGCVEKLCRCNECLESQSDGYEYDIG